MKPILGFWLICEAIVVFVLSVDGDLSLKEKAIAGTITTLLLIMIFVGSCMLVGIDT